MAYDLPIIATRWSAIPDMLPPAAILVERGDANELLAAINRLAEKSPPPGVLRQHYLAHYTTDRHLQRLAKVLQPQSVA